MLQIQTLLKLIKPIHQLIAILLIIRQVQQTRPKMSRIQTLLKLIRLTPPPIAIQPVQLILQPIQLLIRRRPILLPHRILQYLIRLQIQQLNRILLILRLLLQIQLRRLMQHHLVESYRTVKVAI